MSSNPPPEPIYCANPICDHHVPVTGGCIEFCKQAHIVIDVAVEFYFKKRGYQ